MTMSFDEWKLRPVYVVQCRTAAKAAQLDAISPLFRVLPGYRTPQIQADRARVAQAMREERARRRQSQPFPAVMGLAEFIRAGQQWQVHRGPDVDRTTLPYPLGALTPGECRVYQLMDQDFDQVILRRCTPFGRVLRTPEAVLKINIVALAHPAWTLL